MDHIHYRIGTKKQTPARFLLVVGSNLANLCRPAVDDASKASRRRACFVTEVIGALQPLEFQL
jgi:hypothetical protein